MAVGTKVQMDLLWKYYHNLRKLSGTASLVSPHLTACLRFQVVWPNQVFDSPMAWHWHPFSGVFDPFPLSFAEFSERKVSWVRLYRFRYWRLVDVCMIFFPKWYCNYCLDLHRSYNSWKMWSFISINVLKKKKSLEIHFEKVILSFGSSFEENSFFFFMNTNTNFNQLLVIFYFAKM